MLKLIINADDFGYSEGVNLGIEHAYQHGIVRSTTLMANMPGFIHALKIAKRNPELAVGVHLNVTAGFPVLRDHKTIMGEDGRFIKLKKTLKENPQSIDFNEIRDEITAQIEKIFSSGVRPTHIDSHHHVHIEEAIFPIVKRIAEQYYLPLRCVYEDHKGKMPLNQPFTDFFSMEFYNQNATRENLLEIIKRTVDKKATSLEIMCHPAFIDCAVMEGSSYNLPRVEELSILSKPGLEYQLRGMGVTLSTFDDIK